MIAADFPPCLSAGVQRTFHFSENLLQHGWQPLILSAHPRIYSRLDENVVISKAISNHIYRAFAADASVHFSIKGKYLGFMENPDKIASWYHHGWRLGMALMKAHNPDVIWSTFPVSTAHRIALKLKLKTGKLWVADFRDPLHSHCEDNYKNITQKAKQIDASTIQYADLVVFATGKMRDLYHKAYPQISTKKMCVIENGYDENIFDKLVRNPSSPQVFRLLYSGGLYQYGRNPEPLFHALSQLRTEKLFKKRRFELIFRGAGNGEEFQNILSILDLQSVVEFLPSVSYRESIQEMKDASALLVLQGKTFNNQIPGKVYEYLATGNPIISLLGKGGATDKLLDSIPNAHVADENDVIEIKTAIKKLLNEPGEVLNSYKQFGRQARGEELVCKLNDLLGSNQD